MPNALVDITAQAETKRRAINAHRSQVATIDMSAGMLGLNAYRAEMNRIRGYAEAYLRLRASGTQPDASGPELAYVGLHLCLNPFSSSRMTLPDAAALKSDSCRLSPR